MAVRRDPSSAAMATDVMHPIGPAKPSAPCQGESKGPNGRLSRRIVHKNKYNDNNNNKHTHTHEKSYYERNVRCAVTAYAGPAADDDVRLSCFITTNPLPSALKRK